MSKLKENIFLALILVSGFFYQLWIFNEIAEHKRDHECKYYQLPTDQELDSIEYNVNIKSVN